MKRKTSNLQKRRKREGKTNYKKRIRLLLSNKPRLVIRPSLNNISAQIVEYHQKGDKIIASANSKELDKIGWKFSKGNLPAAYLTGVLAGINAKEKGIKEAILDIGLSTPTKGSRIFACLKGVIDSGVNVPASKEIFPSEDRIKGEHIAKHASSIKTKENIDLTQIPKTFEEIKNKIIKVK